MSGRSTRGANGRLAMNVDGVELSRVLDAGGDLAVVLDGRGLVLEVQARDADLARRARRDWRGKPWSDAVTVESRDKIAALLAGALAGDTPAPRQVNHPAGDGPDMPVAYSVVRVSGEAQAPAQARLVALGRDLRDVVALQHRLVEAQQTMERDYWRFREAETRYRHLFQATSEAVLVVDGASLRVVEANPAALALAAPAAGRAARVVGQPVASLFGPESAEPLAAALAAARSVGRHDRLNAVLAGSGQGVALSMSSFRQDDAAFVLIRLAALPAAPVKGRGKGAAVAAPLAAAESGPSLGAAYVRGAADALAFTDSGGRVVAVNAAFARLAQLSSEDQARGEPLDRWVGSTGVELSVLRANLRDQGRAALFVTQLRGALGLVTEVEIAASALEPGLAPAGAAYAFALRDVGRRLPGTETQTPMPVPTSVQQLTGLVGRVPLKQIVAETADLIERLSIQTALEMTRDNRVLAAQLLGLSRQSLYVKLRRFGMLGSDSDGE